MGAQNLANPFQRNIQFPAGGNNIQLLEIETGIIAVLVGLIGVIWHEKPRLAVKMRGILGNTRNFAYFPYEIASLIHSVPFPFRLSMRTAVTISASPAMSTVVKLVCSQSAEITVAETGSIQASMLAFTEPISLTP